VLLAGTMLGRALTQLSTILDPDEIIIGGSLGHAAAPLLLPAATAEMASRWPFRGHRRLPEVRVDSIGPYAAAVGAALASQHLDHRENQ
jgi:predicted NBD/HSP70 family sugar kinase